MKFNKKEIILLLVLLIIFSCTKTNNQIYIPVAGNSWVTSEHIPIAQIGESGVENWSGKTDKIRTYFYIKEPANLQIKIKLRVRKGESNIRFSIEENSIEKRFSNSEFKTIEIGKMQIKDSGYHFIEMQGISKTGDVFADVSYFVIEANTDDFHYVKDEFYWGRRGPSVHLNYLQPDSVKVVWFYNEVTVPKGNDVIGSFFMANGFAQGYFGMQVNSKTERRILFSVWSPFQTDDPAETPEEARIKLLLKGENVYTGEFGNEGSGGQSYLRYNWQADTTYRFLLKGQPSVNSSTDFTAYFFAPEVGNWQLIASFRRPQTSTYLNRLHSFQENFIPETGNISRKAYYSNQWICDTNGNWQRLTEAKLTADATARKQARLDFTGGIEQDKFFLKNCGFFDEKIEIGSVFKRDQSEKNQRLILKELLLF